MCACPGPTVDVPARECTSWSPKTVGFPLVGRCIPDSAAPVCRLGFGSDFQELLHVLCLLSQQLLNEENLRKQEESVQKQEAMRRGRWSPRMGGFVGHLSP